MHSMYKMHCSYLTFIFMKKRPDSNKFITKLISTENSTNPQSFTGFGCGDRIDWRNSLHTLKYDIENLITWPNLNSSPNSFKVFTRILCSIYRPKIIEIVRGDLERLPRKFTYLFIGVLQEGGFSTPILFPCKHETQNRCVAMRFHYKTRLDAV
jgi:hypothetical protein